MRGVRGFALDEYVGLPAGHPESYRAVITREVVEPLGLTPELVRVPNGDPATIQHAGADYEAAITAAGGVDLQILGIGRTGHIGFNEPGSSLASLTRVKTLTERTRADNARFFDSPDDVPMHCITQGIGTILRARHLVLLAFGEAKAHAVAAAVEGPVSASQPGSAIQLHPHTTVVVDASRGIRAREPRLLPARVGEQARLAGHLSRTDAAGHRSRCRGPRLPAGHRARIGGSVREHLGQRRAGRHPRRSPRRSRAAP